MLNDYEYDIALEDLAIGGDVLQVLKLIIAEMDIKIGRIRATGELFIYQGVEE